jgi:prepilin-type N-terminal cleavage/methylation domain-containing protein
MPRPSDDAGFSLVELMVALGLFSIILIAVLNMFDSGTRAERSSQARQSALLELREAMSYVTRDLRQATRIDATPASGPSKVDMRTLVSGTERRVVYEVVQEHSMSPCTTSTPSCRLVRKLDGASTGSVLATRLQPTVPDPAFCYSYDTAGRTCIDGGVTVSPLTAVRVTLALDPDVFAGPPIKLATDIELRNL